MLRALLALSFAQSPKLFTLLTPPISSKLGSVLGRTFIRDADKANAFSKLSRYETAIERNLYKAWHEL